ncbi:MAG TPA: hypothetical protein PKB07_17875 [Flavilitoribacter sp.]|nr:hypothetical protein [Flavilitoribacter sp.]
MNQNQIQQILHDHAFPGEKGPAELVQTLISWVMLTPQYAFKIKKPVQFPFLDFSSPEKRKVCCEAEVRLNNRLTEGIYLGVLPIRLVEGASRIGGTGGEIVDYAVQMIRLDDRRQMSRLLRSGGVTPEDMQQLARQLAVFHTFTEKIRTPFDKSAAQADFEDILKVKRTVEIRFGGPAAALLDRAVDFSDRFLNAHGGRLEQRIRAGLFLDGHGDLHSNNIFLLNEPVIFDCIEFNEHLRRVDALNEVAFLCMDLNFYGRDDLEQIFLDAYSREFPAVRKEADRKIFHYFKLYRANVRAKVHLLNEEWTTAGKYLELMKQYLEAAAF